MKLFARSGGYWLFWISAIYLATGLYCALYYKEIPTALIQVVWLLVIAMPLYFPPLGRWLNMNIDWDKRMFNFFGKRTAKDFVAEARETYLLPEIPKTEVTPPMPETKEKDAKVYYRLGLTDNNRVSFQMGYNEITMNREGCQQVIDQIAFFMNQLPKDDVCQDEE